MMKKNNNSALPQRPQQASKGVLNRMEKHVLALLFLNRWFVRPWVWSLAVGLTPTREGGVHSGACVAKCELCSKPRLTICL